MNKYAYEFRMYSTPPYVTAHK